MQYEFHEQWTKVKEYAHKKGIQIVGDVPIYVAFDSADTWANPELFQLDEKNLPLGFSRAKLLMPLSLQSFLRVLKNMA